MSKKLFVIVVSLLASCAVVVPNANSATSVPSATIPRVTHPLTLRIRVTAYVPTQHSKTSSGRNANLHPGIAADWRVLPKGTKVSIPGKGTFVVDDKGPAMQRSASKGIYHIDLRILPSSYGAIGSDAAYQAAVNHANAIGRTWVDVLVIPPSSGE